MIGIKRLRKLAEPCETGFVRVHVDMLNSIADQIERDIERETQPKSDHAEDVSMSAYDLLPPDERDAIAWVREHGGLDEVKAHWTDHIPLSNVKRMVELHKKKRDRLKAHAWELERKCAERRERIKELNKAIADMRPRLMPEGMEWLVEAWPRFEDGELLGRGGELMTSDGAVRAEELSLTICDKDGGVASIDFGERVKRPAPKVLDADGAEIRARDHVWHVETGQEYVVVSICYEDGVVVIRAGDKPSEHEQYAPSQLTHRAPVLAADGRPLREGETVWVTRDSPCDAPLDKGDEVTVRHAYQKFVSVEDRTGGSWFVRNDHLTHERPVSDTWERLEEDANTCVCVYFGASVKDCDNCDHNSWECSYDKAEDLVRRSKALAERERGE